jgi:opacity protein-like surface antigen
MPFAAGTPRADGRSPSTCAQDSDHDWHICQYLPTPATDKSPTPFPDTFLHKGCGPPKGHETRGDCSMKFRGFVFTAVLLGVSGPAFAQGQQSATTPTNQAVANTPTQVATTPVTTSDNARNWVVSGYLGAAFGASRSSSVDLTIVEDLDNNNSTGVNFGGQIAYLGRGVIGGEFLFDFSPGLGTLDNALFTQSPDVNSYMFNVIAVAPFGHGKLVDPYISGGIGVVTLNATIFTVNPFVANPLLTSLETANVDGSRFGWNLGGGIMAFSERNWGFRADLRYLRTTSNDVDIFDINDIGDGSIFSDVALSGLSMWKGNFGLSYRW